MVGSGWRDYARNDFASDKQGLVREWEDHDHKRGPAIVYFVPYPNTGGQEYRVVTRTVDGGVEIVLIEYAEDFES